MPVPDAIMADIRSVIGTGFEPRERVIETFCHDFADLDPANITAAVDLATNDHESSKALWPDVTDWDRLDRSFIDLLSRRVIGMHYAGYDVNDARTVFGEHLELHPQPDTVLGYCFYHSQDAERAVRGGGLYLGFGPTDADQDDTVGLAIGHLVVTALVSAGLFPQWDGAFTSRVFLPQFRWQRR